MPIRFDPQPICLEGKHVCLEPLSLQHAEALYAASDDDTIWSYLSVPPPQRLDDITAWIRTALDESQSGAIVPFVIVHRGESQVVGSTRYLDIQRGNCGLEIGSTWVGRAYQRTPVNTECKYLLLRHAFDTLGAVRVQLKTDERNVKSQLAIERLGAVREGILRKHRLVWDGVLRSSVYYSILDTEWPAVKDRLEGFLAR